MNHTSRRSFLKASGLAAGALSFPSILHAQNKGDKLRVAVIATGGKGGAHINQIKHAGDIVACYADVDKNAWGGVAKDFPNAKGYQDYRQLFDKEKDYDAVMIATPDHHHFLPTVLAMQAGKHCYTQKPLTHTVWEARQLHQGTQKLKLATQMGNQGHSNAGNRRIYEFVNSGMLGDIKEIHCVSNRPIWPQGNPRPAGEDPVPANLDWDLWLGPAPKRPYKAGKEFYHPFGWRGYYDFGGGALADMACHTMDSIFMSVVPGYPTSVEVLEIYKHSDDMFPRGSIIKWSYGPGKLANGKDRPGFDVYWYDGKLELDGKEVDASDVLVSKVPAELLAMPDGQKLSLKGSGNLYVGTKCGLMVNGDYGDRSRIVPVAKAKEVGEPPKMLERIGNGDENAHYSDWRVACVGEKPWDHPGSNFTYAAPFTETILLGNIALRVGKGKALNYDGPNMKFTNSDEANKYITKEYRAGWDIKLV